MRKAIKCCKQGLGGPGRQQCRELYGLWRPSPRGPPILANWSRDHACVILAKNVAAFYPCPKNLLEAKFKSNELISVTEISVVVSKHSYLQ